MTVPQGPNQRWSLDFLSDAFTDGRKFRIFAVVDDFSRECLGNAGTSNTFPILLAHFLLKWIRRPRIPVFPDINYLVVAEKADV